MMRVFTTLTVVLVAVAIAWVSGTTAQQAPAQPAPAQAEQQLVEGKIKTVDLARKIVTLVDDTKLMLPDTLKVSRADLKPGAAIKAAYVVKDGQKVVTSMEVQQ